MPEVGGLTAGDRLNRLEDQREEHLTDCADKHRTLDGTIADLRVELARQSTRVAVIVGGLAVVGSAVIQFAFRMWQP